MLATLLFSTVLVVPAALAEAQDAARRPTLCVDVQTIAATATQRLSEKELVQAVRARIARRQLHVESCHDTDIVAPTWRLSAMPHDEGTLLLVVSSDGERVGHVLSISGLKPEQVIQLVALTAAEDVRPALDRLLQQLGIAEEDVQAEAEPLDELIKSVEEQAAQGDNNGDDTAEVNLPAAAAPSVPSPSLVGPLSFDASTGPLGGLFDPELTLAAVVGATLGVGPVDLRVHLAGRPLPSLEDPLLTVSGAAVSAGVMLRWRYENLSLGAGLSGRLTQVDVVGHVQGVAKGGHSYWDAALSADGRLVLYRLSFLELALVFHADVWWQPREIVVADRRLYRQPLLEAFLGPAVGIVLAP